MAIFISIDTDQRYAILVVSKQLIPERGFQNPSGQVMQMIVNKGWKLFFEEPYAAIVNIVGKLFANGKEAVENNVGYTIDVGKLIYSSLNYIIRGTTYVGFGHPSLIYALHVNVGVRGDHSEEQLFPIQLSSKEKLKALKDYRSAICQYDPASLIHVRSDHIHPICVGWNI
ncbi:hypothetical protein IEQ34_010896 [Dendrobium chrysotoxum]|uniref:Uncharacterized protein n=1 Tax=Dendrobium chrysotoxum TaxID=161865 RepID=A0AAV7GX27_DENCH|nr:hypothetical protein IEQ34_010896 [Dendrobium chrysotoxum]